ncbi:hypothetical protein ACIBL5_11350 [Streptomyces sp. NPDC050516]|uniref:hypothetical protein n=1 Tax=Streptomyces sp. NPDC050516 TaxID=3365621 RepID=UPI00379F456D
MALLLPALLLPAVLPRAQRRDEAQHDEPPKAISRGRSPSFTYRKYRSLSRLIRSKAQPMRPSSGTDTTPIADPQEITRLDICRRDRLGGILHEYQQRLDLDG